jgi:16S rRNA (guanine966-N2)-methyltransferase
MRVISGDAKGRKLVAPDVPGLRPTSDRVREAMFDILEARELVEGAAVLDLFAGSGALGIEALSRGASRVTFVEQDRRALAAIEDNLARTGYLGSAGVRLVRADAIVWTATHGRGAIDVALVDPPYGFEGFGQLLTQLDAPTVLIEHRSPVTVPVGYDVSREYRYGGTLVTLLEAAVAVQAADAAVSPDVPDTDTAVPDTDKDHA